ncbi:MAG: PilZ domain-containing protein [Chloroflexi bacterium]|nr:PilZ domain-containing protein [Chloroflexota bacterium]
MSRLRMERRRKLINFTPVYDVHTSTVLGYLGDLTLKGALMVSEKPVETGRTLTLAIEFRDTPETSPSMHMIISARVAWCKLEDHHTYYNVGMEFLEVTKQNRETIEKVLEKYEIVHKRPKPGNE